MQDSSSHQGVESRAAPRTNLFLAATLNSGGVRHAVKIRDLSAIGARIETAVVPQVGAAVTLVRGGLNVHARIGWNAERFCGLTFAAPVSIEDWMANPMNLQRQPEPPAVLVEAAVATPVRWQAENSGSVAEQLGHFSRWLAGFGQTLSNDPHVVFNHGTELFSLGLAARDLAAMADKMQDESSRSAAKITP